MSASTLPSSCRYKLPSDNYDLVKDFIDRGVDPHIFDIGSCKNFDCFVLLVDLGNVPDKYSIRKFFDNIYGWNLETKSSVVTFLMDNQELSEKLDLNHTIFYHIISCAWSNDLRNLFETVVINYPHAKADAFIAFRFREFIDILEPAFEFSSKDLIQTYLSYVASNRYDAKAIFEFSNYCDPEDYLSKEVFQQIFNAIQKSDLEKFISDGFVPKLGDYPKNIEFNHAHLFDYLKSVNLWDPETFDWDKHTYRCEFSCWEFSLKKWLIENGCPEHITNQIDK
jgi:hypothetical protein